METAYKEEKYNVAIIEMIRNNNIVINNQKNMPPDYDTYFMLDYFDLLFHKKLVEKDKIYRKFWNIKNNHEEKLLSYKAAYKTLSLYTENNIIDKCLFNEKLESDYLSDKPFLGIIQIKIHWSRCCIM